MTIVGLLVTGFCILFLKGKPHRNGWSYIVEVGGNWGGLELGAVALCGRYTQEGGPCYNPEWFEHTRRHEFGHTIQNIMFGPLYLFIIFIPSAVRYHYRNWRTNKGLENDDYDAIWLEGTATKWGTYAINHIEK